MASKYNWLNCVHWKEEKGKKKATIKNRFFQRKTNSIAKCTAEKRMPKSCTWCASVCAVQCITMNGTRWRVFESITWLMSQTWNDQNERTVSKASWEIETQWRAGKRASEDERWINKSSKCINEMHCQCILAERWCKVNFPFCSRVCCCCFAAFLTLWAH